jgi:malic enzyme
MAKNPIVFAMANPDPEISYEADATAARNDVIMATGRSDYPNQVNNVLGFPYIFRGALDVRATTINEAMKLAAVKALAESGQNPCSRYCESGLQRQRPLVLGLIILFLNQLTQDYFQPLHLLLPKLPWKVA